MSDFHFKPVDEEPEKPLDPGPARALWDLSETVGQVEGLLDQGKHAPEAVVERPPMAPNLARKFRKVNEVLHAGERGRDPDLRPFRHPDGTVHLADYRQGLEIDNRPPGVAAICDFCSEEHAGHVLEIPDFQQYVPEADVVINNTGGGWMACDACYPLVLAGRKEALLARSVDGSLAKKAREGGPPVSRGQLVRRIASVHEEFWKRWTWIYGDPPPVTPQSALGIVQSLQRGIAGAVWSGHEALRQLEHARAVLWRRDLWRAAQRGAHEAFAGQAHPYQVLTCEPQFWFIEPRLPELDEPETLAMGELPKYSRYMCLFLCPVDSDLGPVIQTGVFYLCPAEDFRQIRIRTALADPQVLALPCEKGFVPFAAGLTFMGQAFCVMQSHPHPRHLVKKAQKKNRPLPEIHTIQLRRAMEPYGEPHARSEGPKEAKEWSCSWIAAAHWKQQPYGPRSSLRKQIYVVPKVVRGDPSKPLREPKGVVYVVSR